jgi:osmoprotectant transport system substrate-binding protein
MSHPRLLLPLLALALGGGLLSGCGSDSGSSSSGTPSPEGTATTSIKRDDANAEVALTIGSKNFTEQRVLAEIYTQGLRAAGFDARTRLNIGDEKQALAAIRSGTVDAYPEYTGTALLSFFGKRADELPRDPQDAFEEAKRGFAADGLVAFPPTPFTSSNEVAVTKETAGKLSLQKISDLKAVAGDLTLAGSRECRQRLDCLKGLQQVYGLHFGHFMVTPFEDRHEVLTSGKADVSIVFTTDPQIQRESEVLLQDDEKMFPPYNSTLVVRKAVADRAGPALGRTLRLIQARLTDENMQELNARVDLDGRSPAEVAKAYLSENGLVPAG